MDKLITPKDEAAIALVDGREYNHADTSALDEIERKLIAQDIAVISRPISVNCNQEFHAAHTSGFRPLTVLDWIVIHATEGGTARSVAVWFENPNSGGSAHLVVDDNDCYRCMKDDEIPWGAPGANYRGLHIEQCGYASWATTMWSTEHRKTLMRAAYKTALHCRRYNIPIRFVYAEGLKKGMKGITTHAECSTAFGGDHTDPGTPWPRSLFMSMVKTYAAGMRIRRVT